ncbi:universal stress protein [Paenibacillus abyssi]|uniref:Universal stress protein UspA n=1 Tax=Paenibacillus abyssi TaxID=1340531 RepID=A0A917LHG1_9BACL|nr:universal stress protein [Paenibacillus abyssi]GGG23640.1 universal stress protein UspA [Paenibacillus abyssi]
MAYQKLLVAYDGSEQSVRALKTGMTMALGWNASLEVLHVYDIPVMIVGEAMIPPPVENSVAMVEEAEHWAAEARSIIAAEPGIQAEVTVLQGDPGKQILETAAEKEIDLIIIGSRGLSGLKELFVGSVSHYVIQNSKVPLHVVK